MCFVFQTICRHSLKGREVCTLLTVRHFKWKFVNEHRIWNYGVRNMCFVVQTTCRYSLKGREVCTLLTVGHFKWEFFNAHRIWNHGVRNMCFVFQTTCRYSFKGTEVYDNLIFFPLLSPKIIRMLSGKSWRNSAFNLLNIHNWVWQQINGKFEKNMAVFYNKSEEFHLLEYTAVKSVECQPTFRSSLLSPTSASNKWPNKNPAWSRYQNLSAIPAKCRLTFNGLHIAISDKRVLHNHSVGPSNSV
jgi:hypothetical protein